MYFLNKGFLKKISITTVVLLLLTLPQISLAGSGNTKQKSPPKIIAKDLKTGTIIIENNGAFFYRLLNDRKMIRDEQISPTEFIVKYKRTKDSKPTIKKNPIQTMIDKYNVKTKVLNDNLGLTLVQMPKNNKYFKVLHELRKNSKVAYVEPNYIVKAQSIPNDAYYALQWGPHLINTESAWNKVTLLKRTLVTIAVLDTGVNADHEDLKTAIVPGIDIINKNNNTNDVMGHGTHVAGIAAGLANNGIGIAGIASGTKIMPVKVLSDDGTGTDADIIEGIKYATDHGAQIINMSLGGPDFSNAIQDAVNYATSHGVCVVTAAGNEDGPIGTPGNCQGVITVGAIENNYQRAPYSNFGPKLNIMAPGSDILSTYIGGSGPSGYTYLSGTSMATPFVSGVVALMKAVNPELTPSKVSGILQRTAKDLGEPGFDHYYGYGLINAEKAVDLALQELLAPTFPLNNRTPS